MKKELKQPRRIPTEKEIFAEAERKREEKLQAKLKPVEEPIIEPEVETNEEELPRGEIVLESAKPDPIPEAPKEEPVSDRPTMTLVSNEDAYIYDRMKSQPKDLNEVLQVKERPYAPGEHRLSLPPELKAYEDRFTFRWINKKKRAIDDAIDVKGWIIVSKALFPNLPRHLFTTAGCVERGDAILAFMAKRKAEAIRRRPGEISSSRIKSSPMISPELPPLPKGKSGLYKPRDTSSEKESDTGETTGFQEGRDF